MPGEAEDIELLRKPATEEERREALGGLFVRYRPRLDLMIRLRLDPRIRSRLDPSDVIQETYMEAWRRLDQYLQGEPMPFYLWLRCIAGQKLTDLHRRHLGARARDARRQVSLDAARIPETSSVALAKRLVIDRTSPSQVAARHELEERVREALDAMDPIDREIIALRHFEQLSNEDAARVLGIQESAASKRHIRALDRLKQILASFGGSDSEHPP